MDATAFPMSLLDSDGVRTTSANKADSPYHRLRETLIEI
jgi:hypothetical protein